MADSVCCIFRPVFGCCTPKHWSKLTENTRISLILKDFDRKKENKASTFGFARGKHIPNFFWLHLHFLLLNLFMKNVSTHKRWEIFKFWFWKGLFWKPSSLKIKNDSAFYFNKIIILVLYFYMCSTWWSRDARSLHNYRWNNNIFDLFKINKTVLQPVSKPVEQPP